MSKQHDLDKLYRREKIGWRERGRKRERAKIKIQRNRYHQGLASSRVTAP